MAGAIAERLPRPGRAARGQTRLPPPPPLHECICWKGPNVKMGAWEGNDEKNLRCGEREK